MNSDTDISSTQWAAAIAPFLALLIPIALGPACWIKQRYARAIVSLQASAASGASSPRPPIAAAEAGARAI
ncbi:MAG TPA: hypothetical protein VMK32_10650 [Burkholderiaceae bacterium]|nr:hypothetical protein [Burkholderiaceae bacterium]